MALLMGQPAAPRAPVDLLIDRGVETLLGILVAGLVIAGEELLRPPAVRSAGGPRHGAADRVAGAGRDLGRGPGQCQRTG